MIVSIPFLQILSFYVIKIQTYTQSYVISYNKKQARRKKHKTAKHKNVPNISHVRKEYKRISCSQVNFNSIMNLMFTCICVKKHDKVRLHTFQYYVCCNVFFLMMCKII